MALDAAFFAGRAWPWTKWLAGLQQSSSGSANLVTVRCSPLSPPRHVTCLLLAADWSNWSGLFTPTPAWVDLLSNGTSPARKCRGLGRFLRRTLAYVNTMLSTSYLVCVSMLSKCICEYCMSQVIYRLQVVCENVPLAWARPMLTSSTTIKILGVKGAAGTPVPMGERGGVSSCRMLLSHACTVRSAGQQLGLRQPVQDCAWSWAEAPFRSSHQQSRQATHSDQAAGGAMGRRPRVGAP